MLYRWFATCRACLDLFQVDYDLSSELEGPLNNDQTWSLDELDNGRYPNLKQNIRLTNVELWRIFHLYCNIPRNEYWAVDKAIENIFENIRTFYWQLTALQLDLAWDARFVEVRGGNQWDLDLDWIFPLEYASSLWDNPLMSFIGFEKINFTEIKIQPWWIWWVFFSNLNFARQIFVTFRRFFEAKWLRLSSIDLSLSVWSSFGLSPTST